MQTTGLKRNIIDKYYTKPSIAKHCCDIFKQYVKINPEIDVIIESIRAKIESTLITH